VNDGNVLVIDIRHAQGQNEDMSTSSIVQSQVVHFTNTTSNNKLVNIIYNPQFPIVSNFSWAIR